MKAYVLMERISKGKTEQVKFFKHYYEYTLCEVGYNSSHSITYASKKTSKRVSMKSFETSGFKHVN